MSAQARLTLDEATIQRLTVLSLRTGLSKPALVAEAMKAFVENQGSSELAALFQGRLDRMTQQMGRIERDCLVLIETLGLLVRYLLTLHALAPEFDAAAQAAGQSRFEDFVDEVSRQLASSRRVADELGLTAAPQAGQ